MFRGLTADMTSAAVWTAMPYAQTIWLHSRFMRSTRSACMARFTEAACNTTAADMLGWSVSLDGGSDRGDEWAHLHTDDLHHWMLTAGTVKLKKNQLKTFPSCRRCSRWRQKHNDRRSAGLSRQKSYPQTTACCKVRPSCCPECAPH